ncbi:MAG: MarC family protein [Methylococcaceae bacterium]
MTEKLLHDAMILWATIDPIGTLVIFFALTRRLEPKARRKVAIKSVFYAALVLLSAVVIGEILLDKMGIHLVSLKLSGGIILFLFGLQMIFGDESITNKEREAGHDIAVFPLAIPSIASPGAILAAILLTDNHQYSIIEQAKTAGVISAILLITLVLMLAATPIFKVIGHNGASILIRVMGMILTALSVEFIMQALHIPQWVA